MKIYLNLSLLVFFFTSINAQTYLNIDVHVAKDTIETNIDNPNFTILDVRTAGEYFPEHIEGAVYRDFYAADFELQLDSLDKTRVFLIYCRSGNRSGQALALMEQLGFQTVYNMLGGMNDWNGANYPVTDEIPPFVDIYANSTSVKEQNLVRVSVFPNPTLNSIEVKFVESYNSDVKFKVLTQLGKVVLNGILGSSGLIDLSMLSEGSYSMILLKDKTVVNTTRVIKI